MFADDLAQVKSASTTSQMSTKCDCTPPIRLLGLDERVRSAGIARNSKHLSEEETVFGRRRNRTWYIMFSILSLVLLVVENMQAHE